MSAWDLTRRARGPLEQQQQQAAPRTGSKTNRGANEPAEPMGPLGSESPQQAVSFWHEQLLAMIEKASRGAASQLPAPSPDAANLVQSLPFLLAASNSNSGNEQQQQQQARQRQCSSDVFVEIPGSLASRSLTPSPSASSHSNSAESIDLSLSKARLPALAGEATTADRLEGPPAAASGSGTPLTTANSSLCSSLSSYSSASSSCGDSAASTSARLLDGPAASLTQDSQLLAQQPPDRKARKKDQNRRAAFNYRRKKMEERDRMIEEEARLVHRHVRLAGKIARLEARILSMLGAHTGRPLPGQQGEPARHACPACSELCDTVAILRAHLRTVHLPEVMPPLEESQSAPSSQDLFMWCDGLDGGG